jgi:hypothetical protein
VGGAVISAVGSGFVNTGESVVHLSNGTNEVTVATTFVTASRMLFIAPAVDAPGSYNVTVSLNNQQYSSSVVKFLYFSVGSGVFVQSIVPPWGPTTGNTSVDVIGANFVSTGSILVRFSSVGASENVSVPATFVSNTLVRCTSPAFVHAGVVAVDMSLNGVDFNSSSASYTYYGACGMLVCCMFACASDVLLYAVPASPTNITSVAPASGPDSGSTYITVTGASFEDTGIATATFGPLSAPVPVTYLSTSTVLVQSPAQGVGSVALEISLNGQQYSTSNRRFRYYGVSLNPARFFMCL